MSKFSKVIAIDGPSGSGKSTIAQDLAIELNFTYLDTGSMFRAIGYCAVKNNIDIENNHLNEHVIAQVVEILATLKFEYAPETGVLIRIDGEDLTSKIREHEISRLASVVSKYDCVRSYLADKQREIAGTKRSLLEGRDIGTVIFPDAALKVFLTASSKERAIRRYDQLVEKEQGNKIKYSLEQIQADIEKRDFEDRNREIAPLKKADDAIEIDTSNFSIEEVKSQITSLYNERKDLF